ncbi:MAG: glycerophosphodiester phosphodiesterase [Chloroflexi bacterium]|nr:glycerophosphodiester phosphodiesterase [Chloroflexota bacterium]
MTQRPVLRIAHAYGNHRERLEEALVGPVDLVEADIWYRSGAIELRHERRAGFLPILLDSRARDGSYHGPWAFPLGSRWYTRLDLWPVRLEELLAKAKGRRGLMLDTKGRYRTRDHAAFANLLARLLPEYEFEADARICGQNWSLLDTIRDIAPHLRVEYTVEQAYQWDAFLRCLERGRATGAICLYHRLLDKERARLLTEHGIDYHCWTVDDPEEAARVLSLGADGITSNSLSLLASLRPERAVRSRRGAG